MASSNSIDNGNLRSDTLPMSQPIDVADAIALRVMSPSVEVVPGGNITFPRIHLDTKISQLKLRIQNALEAAPAPSLQKLIYRGHVVHNGDATLRQVLRPPNSTEPHVDTYAIHLVLLPSSSAFTAPAISAPPPAQANPNITPSVGHHPSAQTAQANGAGPLPGTLLPHQVAAQAQQNHNHARASQMMLQNQLQMLQQRFQDIHRQVAQVQTHLNPAPGVHVTYEVHHGPVTHQTQQLPPSGTGISQVHNPQNVLADVQATLPDQELSQRPVQASEIHPTSTSPAGQTQRVDHLGPGNTDASNPHSHHTAQVHDSSQTGGQLPAASTMDHMNQHREALRAFHPPDAIQSTDGMDQHREALRAFHYPEPTPIRHNPPIPTMRPASTDATGRENFLRAPPTSRLTSFHGMNASGQQPNNVSIPTQTHMRTHPLTQIPLGFRVPPQINPGPSPSTSTMAWILSSPSGPEGLVFSPGHGYFTTTPQPTPVRSPPMGDLRNVPFDETLSARAGVAAVPIRPNAAQAREVQHAAQQRGENVQMNLLISRAWLFLRMLVVIWFLSEAGSLRQYLLIVVSFFICFFLEIGFIRRLLGQVRGHVDRQFGNLGTPPAVGAAANAQPAAPDQGPNRPVAGQQQPPVEPTPETNAARLLREHNDRNPNNVVLDILGRTQRVVTMFLASLVPGLGERQVRDHEAQRALERRNEAERLENERRTREEAAAQPQSEPATEISTSTNNDHRAGGDAASTSIQTRPEGGEGGGGGGEARERKLHHSSPVGDDHR